MACNGLGVVLVEAEQVAAYRTFQIARLYLLRQRRFVRPAGPMFAAHAGAFTTTAAVLATSRPVGALPGTGGPLPAVFPPIATAALVPAAPVATGPALAFATEAALFTLAAASRVATAGPLATAPGVVAAETAWTAIALIAPAVTGTRTVATAPVAAGTTLVATVAALVVTPESTSWALGVPAPETAGSTLVVVAAEAARAPVVRALAVAAGGALTGVVAAEATTLTCRTLVRRFAGAGRTGTSTTTAEGPPTVVMLRHSVLPLFEPTSGGRRRHTGLGAGDRHASATTMNSIMWNGGCRTCPARIRYRRYGTFTCGPGDRSGSADTRCRPYPMTRGAPPQAERIAVTAGSSGSTAAPPHRKVAMATLVGTTLEWYDFMLYGTASALIFGKQFFPSMSPAAGTLAAFATFAVGFGARPIGGLLFGHFGDRVGRRTTLVVSLILMGVSSTLIGALPTYADVGFWAPVLLVLARLVQGVGLGGEGAGAVVFSMEHAPHGKLNRYASFPQMGTPAGLVLANAVFLGTSALLPEDAFLSWGWRIPFLLSAVLVLIGLAVRLTVTESAQYADLIRRGEVVAFPLRAALRVGPARLLLILCAAIATSAVVYIFMTFTLTYGTESLEFSRDFLLSTVIVSSVLWCVTMPLWGALADRYGTHRIYLAGSVALVVWSAAYFPLLDTGNAVVVSLALLGMGLVLPVAHSVGGIIVAELFPPAVRYSGTSLIVQVSVILGGGLAPLIATALWTAGSSSLAVTCYSVGICVLSAISTYVLFWVLPRARADRNGDATTAAEEQQAVRVRPGA